MRSIRTTNNRKRRRFILCRDGHLMDHYFHVGPGFVMVGCTKCPYWEQAINDSTVEVVITLS